MSMGPRRAPSRPVEPRLPSGDAANTRAVPSHHAPNAEATTAGLTSSSTTFTPPAVPGLHVFLACDTSAEYHVDSVIAPFTTSVHLALVITMIRRHFPLFLDRIVTD